jgi:hypothetical protein
MYDKKACQKYRLTHPEQIKERNKKYRLVHPEKMRVCRKKWRIEHSKQRREYQNKWELTNREQRKEYWLKHPEIKKESHRRYFQTLKGRTAQRKANAAKRQLSFVPLNQHFNGSCSHHIDTTRVIYIPTEMHRYINHNITKNTKMDAINLLAFNWLEAEELYTQTIK